MMSLNLEGLSAEVLLGIANEHLRHNCKDKAALFYDLDICSEHLEKTLNEAGFSYDAKSNQYRDMK
ncbi:DUF4250 domain-containing protein [Shewanella eurypsychrophilus]|uniref:DUF4250 domain-containing protein n=2 Tax=Shewanella eurypsychrophilus TaxID=2593656 RepID=A0ABX6VAE7_9GAMM|nr:MULTISPECIES: DUF4250 domain-containing protein [Shewanella]QFU22175.1 DUF4250 domain-containing protein [Shewanella sp. YLB-09]QPG57462.1 DUF4250 domain-containing protein [Shewanella eurypsychrophilus]